MFASLIILLLQGRGAYVIYLLAVVLFFNDTATTEIYTLSLHDALPISDEVRRPDRRRRLSRSQRRHPGDRAQGRGPPRARDRKSTRLNSSHANISYAVFCLKKKTTTSSHQR